MLSQSILRTPERSTSQSPRSGQYFPSKADSRYPASGFRSSSSAWYCNHPIISPDPPSTFHDAHPRHFLSLIVEGCKVLFLRQINVHLLLNHDGRHRVSLLSCCLFPVRSMKRRGTAQPAAAVSAAKSSASVSIRSRSGMQSSHRWGIAAAP